jgi:hypothetical protein
VPWHNTHRRPQLDRGCAPRAVGEHRQRRGDLTAPGQVMLEEVDAREAELLGLDDHAGVVAVRVHIGAGAASRRPAEETEPHPRCSASRRWISSQRSTSYSTNAEAIYLGPENGTRTLHMVFEMDDSRMIPQITEPFYQKLNATVDLLPIMNQAELKPSLERLAASPS